MRKGIIFFIFSSFFLVLLLSLNLVSAVVLCNSELPGGCPKVITTTSTSATNYSLVNVNNSLYWQGHTGTDGSWLTGISMFNLFDQVLNTTSNVKFKDLNLSGELIVNKSVRWLESSGIQNLFYINPLNGDGFRMEYWYDFELPNDDWLIFHKTDGNDASPDGGIGFMMGNSSGDNKTILKLDGYGLANFTDYNIQTTGNITAQYFEGDGSLLTGIPKIGNCPAGQVVQNTTTGGVQCVDRVDPSTTYYVNVTSITGGTIDTADINLTYWYDLNTYNISEGGGINPLTLYMNYTNVTTFSQWILREYYLGSSSHHLKFQIWDYASSTWEDYFEIVGQTGQTWIVVPVFDTTDHVGTGANLGVVQTRIYHPENGISSHRLYIDVAWLLSGNNIGASTNLDGYAKYNFGFNNFAGNGTFITSANLTATNGFFSNLGSALSRITKGWFTDVDVSGGNINMNTGNITNVTYFKLNEVSGACDITVNHTICSNATGTYITG